MPKLSQRAERMPASPIRKLVPYAVQARDRGIKIYSLNIGQPDIETPQVGLDALKHIDRKVLEYSPSDGLPSYRNKLVGYYARFGIDLSPENIIVTTGGSEALQLAFPSCINPGDEIIMTEPTYANYISFAMQAGVKVRPIKTDIRNGYALPSVEDFEALIDERTKAILICNPNNPTGYVYTKEEMMRIRDIVKKYDLFLFSDEVYREFVYGGEKLMSLLQLEGYEDNVVVIDSVSKRFSACGARIGCVITRNSDLYNNAMKWCQGRLCASTIDQVASAALYTVGPEYFDAVRKEYKARRDTLVEGLKKIPGVIYSEPKGAFYVMAKLPVDDAEKFQLFMLEEFDDNGDTLMFTPAESFYKTPHTGVNEIRMAYVINQDALKRSMELLAKGIEAYNNH